MRAVTNLLSPVADLFLPPRCQATNTDATASHGLSENIRLQIATLAAQPYCLHCGLTIGPYEVHDASNPCGRCGDREVGVVRLARVGTFSDPLVTLIHRLKFGRTWEIAPILAPFIYQALLHVSETTRIPVDALVPIPLHWYRRAKRGFNQSAEIARAVGKLSAWRVSNALRRSRLTREQARIDAPTLRAENMRNAFAARQNARRGLLAGKHIWLLDDVTTTGATLHSAATTLRRLPKQARPASINAVVVCVTDHRYFPGDPPALP